MHPPPDPAPPLRVEEVQGLYGPFSFSEKLLQRLWRSGEFDQAAARLLDGRALRILHPGRWNLLGGPDFREARLEFAGLPVRGDVELHLHAGDWAAHRHATDPAYDGVVLHAVLFPPDPGHATLDREGRPLPVLVLLPLLQRGLEEFAAEAAVDALAGRPNRAVVEGLDGLASGAGAILGGCARRRWEQKVRFARLRVQRLGWEQACHAAALEILGYRFNRAPMLRIAGRWPLADWVASPPSVEVLFESERGAWAAQGARPANLPRERLAQYARWLAALPDWPRRLRAAGADCGARSAAEGEGTAGLRRRWRLGGLRAEWRRALTADQVGGTRFDTLVCDGFLPLLAAEGIAGVEVPWLHWFPGDQPPLVLQTLRELGLTGPGGAVASQGLAQGFLGWLIEADFAARNLP